LTNDSLNKIAYIGQGACCLYAGVPSTITMEAWSLLTNEVKERSNKIALDVINQWESNNKFIQLCLKLD
jgi:protoheme ferro-lyase